MGRTIYHIVPKNGKWKIQKEKSSKASAVKNEKEKAVNRARELAKNDKPSQIIIHKMDGKINNEHTYGSDPEKYEG